ncbi:MAG: NADPH-dependent 7-cyano-7-deazaguanine reductase QueF [Pseudomonadota bacterium]
MSKASTGTSQSDGSLDKGPLLGKQVSGSASYDPSLLFPVPRANARQTLPATEVEFFGADVWHAYELSWLMASGMPQMFTGTFAIPCTSPNIVESKSLKLYLNSLNNHRFASEQAAVSTIEADVSRVLQDKARLILTTPGGIAQGLPTTNDNTSDHKSGANIPFDLAECLDALQAEIHDDPSQVSLAPRDGDARVHTHLMRSLCPVTAQPDWATVIITTRGRHAEPASLLSYLLSYRNHQEFHEQCVERIFCDLMLKLDPAYLEVHALYTRRGGLDISPWRCSEDKPAPLFRLDRQ